MSGCRCADCRKANSRYENERQKARRAGDWNGIVSAEKAQAHLLRLSEKGVGTKTVAQATDLARTILFQIAQGTRTHIRGRTERKILAVTPECAADGALIPAGPTWKLINELISLVKTKSAAAQLLGFKGRGIQISKRQVKVRTAADVRALHKRITGGKLVSPAACRRKLAQLIEEGFKPDFLAKELGTSEGALQLKADRIPVKFADEIAALHERLMQ